MLSSSSSSSSSSSPLLLLLLLLLHLLQPAPTHAGKNPCHPNKVALGRDVSCQKIVWPGWLCPACRLKAPRASGEFANCRSIYDVTAPACKAQLKYYASLNSECDPVRKAQVKDFSKRSNVQGLDYFVYSVCEQCCDCVPRGAKTADFSQRKKDNTLLSVNRGNCPAHAWFDVCKVWPKVRYVVRPDGQFPPRGNKNKLPSLCPLLTKWIKRKNNNPWLLKSYVWVDPPIVNFFNSFFNVANCKQPKVWNSCTDLEDKQDRL